MQILEHGQEQEQTLLFFPAQRNPFGHSLRNVLPFPDMTP